MILFPNAKINLGLSIIEKRSDNFHNINSIFYPIPLKDALEAVIAPELPFGEIQFTFSGLEIPGKVETNLCVKAYSLLHQEFQLPGIKAHLHKCIPMGAGLGGGSSDAAHLIHILNEICSLQLSLESQLNLASQLGSDCSFFIKNQAAFCYGRGELFEPVSISLSGYSLVLIYPAIHIGTKEAYAGVIPKLAEFNLNSLQVSDITNWKRYLKNDFEESIFPQWPRLNEIKNKLYESGAIYSSMSGSGSAIFGLFENKINSQHLEKYGQIWQFDL